MCVTTFSEGIGCSVLMDALNKRKHILQRNYNNIIASYLVKLHVKLINLSCKITFFYSCPLPNLKNMFYIVLATNLSLECLNSGQTTLTESQQICFYC